MGFGSTARWWRPRQGDDMRNAVFICVGFAVAFGSSPMAVAQSVTIAADASQVGPAMSRDQLGANLFTEISGSGDPAYIPLLSSAGINLIRWPGRADFYHWQTNSYSVCSPALSSAAAAFDTWMTTIVKPLGADVAITVNYGSNPACTGRADPNEAAQKLIKKDVLDNRAANPGEADVKRCSLFKELDPATKKALYDAWAQVKGH